MTVPSLILHFTLFLAIALIGARLTNWLGIPDLVGFLLIGFILGPDVLNFLPLPHSGIAHHLMDAVIGISLALVLFDAGLQTSLGALRRHLNSVLLLSTAGILLTTLSVTAISRPLFNWTALQGFQTGAIMASTDPTAVMPILSAIILPTGLFETLVSEAAIGDITSSLLTTGAISLSSSHNQSTEIWITGWTVRTIGSIIIGVLIGILSRRFLTRIPPFDAAHLFPFWLFILITAGYGLGEEIGGSGFLSDYIAGLLIGNPMSLTSFLPAGSPGLIPTVSKWAHSLVFGSHILIFGLLGAQMHSLKGEISPLHLIIFVLAFLYLIRPAIVFALVPFDRRSRFSLKSLLFMSYIRETGILSAALLALYRDHLTDGEVAVISWTIIGTLLLPAMTTRTVAKKLFGDHHSVS